MTDPASDTTAFEAVEVVIPSDPAEARSVQDRIELSLAASDASERDILGAALCSCATT